MFSEVVRHSRSGGVSYGNLRSRTCPLTQSFATFLTTPEMRLHCPCSRRSTDAAASVVCRTVSRKQSLDTAAAAVSCGHSQHSRTCPLTKLAAFQQLLWSGWFIRRSLLTVFCLINKINCFALSCCLADDSVFVSAYLDAVLSTASLFRVLTS